VATHTHPDQWAGTDPAMIGTVLDVLERRNRGR